MRWFFFRFHRPWKPGFLTNWKVRTGGPLVQAAFWIISTLWVAMNHPFIYGFIMCQPSFWTGIFYMFMFHKLMYITSPKTPSKIIQVVVFVSPKSRSWSQLSSSWSLLPPLLGVFPHLQTSYEVMFPPNSDHVTTRCNIYFLLKTTKTKRLRVRIPTPNPKTK